MMVSIIECLEDNYAYILEDTLNKKVIVVDAPEFEPIDNFLLKKNSTLTDILCTHHHGDHVGANLKLKEKHACQIWGSLEDKKRIPGITKTLTDQENFSIGSLRFQAHAVPGHTSHHLIYHLAQEKILFTGDTLFSMGCGRLFEGSYEEMFASLKEIARLPEDTLIYCGHEYSEKNARFAKSTEPQNQDIENRYQEVLQLRQENKPTVPTSLALEKKINPFLRAKNLEEFKSLRKLRDTF